MEISFAENEETRKEAQILSDNFNVILTNLHE